MLLNLLQPKAVKRLAFRASESVLPQLPDRCSSRRPDQTAEITLHFSLHMPSHCSHWNDSAVERSVNRDSGSGWLHGYPGHKMSQVRRGVVARPKKQLAVSNSYPTTTRGEAWPESVQRLYTKKKTNYPRSGCLALRQVPRSKGPHLS